ncbi:MAG: hypothetical protein RR415_07035 [Ruthenibacterium sp.]
MMNNTFYQQIQGYISAMTQARQMLGKKLISEEEYTIIDTIIARKYALSSCSIFRDNALIYIENHGNM